MTVVRILLWFAGLSAVALVAAWLADHPGAVVVDWGSYRIETSAAVTTALFLFLLLGLVVIGRLIRWVAQGSPKVRESWRRRGYQALTRGLVAVAEGDGGNARRHAKRAGSLIKEEQPLTSVLLAQAAQLDGDEQAARRHFTRMLDNPDTEFLGLRGLIVDANRRGDTGEALKLARRAQDCRPGSPWILNTLFELETREGLWQDAQQTLARSTRKKLVSPVDAKRRKALVLYQRAREDADAGEDEAALDSALRASGFAHDFVPAAVLAARLAARSRPRKAARVIERTWRVAPHPELAIAYAEIYAADLPARRVKRFVRLAGMNPSHPQSHLAVADAAVAAGLWGVAWNNLQPLVESDGATSAQACRLMAVYKRDGNGDPTAAEDWDRRALASDEMQVWRCVDCGHEGPLWEPICPGCNGFDTQVWRDAAQVIEPDGAITIEPEIVDPGDSPVRSDTVAGAPVDAVEKDEQSQSVPHA